MREHLKNYRPRQTGLATGETERTLSQLPLASR